MAVTNSLFMLPVGDIRAMYAVEGRKTRLNTDLRHNPFSHVGGGRNFGKTLFLQQAERLKRIREMPELERFAFLHGEWKD